MQEMQFDLWEMVTNSSNITWEIPWISRGAWQPTVHGVAKSGTQLNDFTSHLLMLKLKLQHFGYLM